jgi:CO dehydrogenase nickel-insertion accessory protein CooC1
VATVIEQVARRSVGQDRTGVIFNRIKPGDDISALAQRIDLPVLGSLPEDDTIALYDREGRSFFELSDCAALDALQGMIADFIGSPGGR